MGLCSATDNREKNGNNLFFKSGGNGQTSPVTMEKKGNKGNEFFYNGNKYIANSLQTLKGRDDNDDRIGAFSGIFSLGESELSEIL
ncbi:hypothetical protein FBD94_14670 [Pedobacter hiemivivus]|uniref:Uncharacterized protein n=1 Tax=Pedobacter hiemivivus TaxID=2530454 RepID=A0A4U1G8J5_9SPHI|nr:hypothetical protein [Pedobacter hiemivivus]TKC60155.1 hypothetical protein FBD94_14670 [Pedobacter hiemivivus]